MMHSENRDMVSQKQKALFIDRDGVINEDTGYPHKPEHIVFMPGIFDFLRSQQHKGYTLIVVTNQAGVAKGFFTEEEVQSLHQWMHHRFQDQGITIAAFYYCPYHPKATIEHYRQDSDLRKPKPGMILQAARDFSIDLTQSVMIGDKASDRIQLPTLRSYIIKSKYMQTGYDVENLAQLAQLLCPEL